jgi:protein SCO1/2
MWGDLGVGDGKLLLQTTICFCADTGFNHEPVRKSVFTFRKEKLHMRYKLNILLVILVFLAAGCAHHGSHNQEGDHTAHQAMMKEQKHYQRSLQAYQVPDVTLLDQNGQKVNLPEYLQASEPYALNFIFTTCTTICPIMTATFSQLQRELGTEAKDLRLISISIDPEYDKPKKLKDYIKKFQMDDNFSFLTGDLDTVISVEKAFDNYTPDKMLHRPATIFKETATSKWVRIEGLATGADLAAEYHQLINQ